ncbi:nuclear transport factor 2 family protein [Marinomonas transparens]|uniref:Nuclear transport factor 2 family protein n=1 Tax=Marinomonas transparens TaxID=2795388 RepID=A0A934JRG1_9GAMM|nr:nuclear transport factor 2 family protein [Marinomonas transparens]MBJ7536060.1 nuclear transport factor 2 family protein [Marinomonas transparens]
MKHHLISAAVVIGVALSGCATTGTPQLSNKEKAIEVMNNLGTADRSSLDYISDKTYIQHNLGVASGKAGLYGFLDKFPTIAKDEDGTVVRAFQDGDYVVTHSYVKAFNSAVFDVFRFEDGLIVEHWDNNQKPANKPNPSGHTMTDGATQITDLDKTQQNKILIKNLIQDVFLEGQFNKITQYISQETYTQHNPSIADGLKGLTDAFAGMAAQGQTVRYEKIHAILGEGNFVLVISGGEINGEPTAFYDLFRVANGKAVEHWDVLKTIPSKDKQMNVNGKFNFPASAMNLSK